MKFTHLFGKFTQIFSPKMGKMVGHPDYSFCSHPSKEKKQLVVWCFSATRAFSLAVGLVWYRTFSGQVHKDIALFLEIKMDDSVNDKKYNYRQQAQLQKSWVRPTAIQSKSARRKPAGLRNKRQSTSVVLTRHSWTKQIHEIEGGLWTFGFHDILIMRWGTPKEKEENI